MARWLVFAALLLTATASAGSASAQSCDPRFPLTCIFIDPFGLFPRPVPPAEVPEQDDPGAPLDLSPPDADIPPPERDEFAVDPAVRRQYAHVYAPVDDERFPIEAVRLSDVDAKFLRQAVYYPTHEEPGTIVIDPHNHFLYLVQGDGRALRYGVGVGRQGFGWSGTATIHNKQEWPDWYPPREMLERQPELARQMSQLQSGLGMPGGPRNPLGARAIYLWQGNKDTLYRIHGTVEPWTIGKSVSSGCIRMINQDVIDLYRRTTVGTRVVVLAGH